MRSSRWGTAAIASLLAAAVPFADEASASSPMTQSDTCTPGALNTCWWDGANFTGQFESNTILLNNCSGEFFFLSEARSVSNVSDYRLSMFSDYNCQVPAGWMPPNTSFGNLNPAVHSYYLTGCGCPQLATDSKR